MIHYPVQVLLFALLVVAHALHADETPFALRVNSEFGGIGWVPEGATAEGWVYGEAPKTETEFLVRFFGLCCAPSINGGSSAISHPAHRSLSGDQRPRHL